MTRFEVISEGVEEEEQLETLKEIGCDYIQGYLWGKPLSEEDARKLVLKSLQKRFGCDMMEFNRKLRM